MARHYYLGIASVLYLICFTAFCGHIAYMLEMVYISHSVKILSDAVMVFSGYAASYFYCLTLESKKATLFMRRFLLVLFVFYIITLVDFTLIDGGFGRNILNFLSWDKNAFQNYIKASTNLVPFATIRLFINGYINDKLTLFDTVINLLGNFVAFMPFSLFAAIFFKKTRSFFKMFLTVLISVVCIELLQFLFLTGSSDVDDVILNTGGAMLIYYAFSKKSLSRALSLLTFGVWNENA